MVMRHELEAIEDPSSDLTVAEMIKDQKLEAISPETSIRDAAMRMVKADIRQLPVVGATEPDRLLGIITLNDIARQQNAMSDQLGRE